jgi:PTS system cellobiose-specific IIC component
VTSGLGFVGALRRFGESPELLAIRTQLPRSFAGLIVGIGIFFFLEHGTLAERFYHAFIEAFAIMAVTLIGLLGWDLAQRRNVPPVTAVLIAFGAFVLSLPYGANLEAKALAYRVGPSGLILGMVACVAAVGALVLCRRFLGPLGGSVAAAALVLGVAAGFTLEGVSLADELTLAMQPLGRLGDTLTALLLITLIEVLLWSIGIHGPALLAAIILPVYLQLQAENTQALIAHHPLPHIVTVSIFMFVFPGGTGATLPLVFMLLRSKVKRIRSVGLVSVGPGIFNVNEPLMFGLPVVFNGALIVPYVVSPMVLAVLTYAAMALGWVARPAYWIPASVPQPIGAFLATNDWRAVVLILVNIAISAAIYLPFVMRYERSEVAKERAMAA